MKKFILLALSPLFLVACNGGSNGSTGFSITSIAPASGSAIPVNQAFTATFNSTINAGTLTGNVTLYNKTAQQYVTITCMTLSNASSIVCTPAANLSANTGYTLTFGSGIQSSSGTSLSSVAYTYTTNNN
jgi:hypothetical protein